MDTVNIGIRDIKINKANPSKQVRILYRCVRLRLGILLKNDGETSGNGGI